MPTFRTGKVARRSGDHKKNLRMQGLTGEIVQGDLFEDISDERCKILKPGTFDVVMSHGFIEHFDDIVYTMRRIYRYARKGGLVITTVPNYNGISGIITRLFSPLVYDLHRKIEPCYLAKVQTDIGGKVLFCDYTGHYSIRPPFRAHTTFKRKHPLVAQIVDLPFKAFNGLSMVLYPLLRYLLPPNKFLSRRISSIAIKVSE